MRKTFTFAVITLLFAGCGGAEFTSSPEGDAHAVGDSPDDGKADVQPDAPSDAGPDVSADAPEDAPYDVVQKDSPEDAEDGGPPADAPADAPKDAGDTECEVTGLRVAWMPPDLSIYGASSITGAYGGVGTMASPNLTDFTCGPAKDLESEPDRYACCFRTDAVAGLKGKDLFFDFNLSNGKQACNTTGCPVPFSQYSVKADGVLLGGLGVTLKDPSCNVASGTCKWVLHVQL